MASVGGGAGSATGCGRCLWTSDDGCRSGPRASADDHRHFFTQTHCRNHAILHSTTLQQPQVGSAKRTAPSWRMHDELRPVSKAGCCMTRRLRTWLISPPTTPGTLDPPSAPEATADSPTHQCKFPSFTSQEKSHQRECRVRAGAFGFQPHGGSLRRQAEGLNKWPGPRDFDLRSNAAGCRRAAERPNAFALGDRGQ